MLKEGSFLHTATSVAAGVMVSGLILVVIHGLFFHHLAAHGAEITGTTPGSDTKGK